jgi:lysine-N-methylase
MAAPDGSLAARDYTSAKIPVEAKNVAILNQLRVLIFRILQWRELALGARVMLLGSLLDELSQVRGKPRFKSFSEFLPVMETYAALFADPSFIEAEFAQLAGNLPRKLQVDDTERDMASMLAHYERIYGDFYLPYFRDKCYVLENYLVNDALVSMFPFNRRTYLDAYRVMVFNLAIIQVMLVGIAGHYQGLTDDRVVQFIQTFTRRSAHNSSYLGKLTEAIASKDSPSFVEVMWMLKER